MSAIFESRELAAEVAEKLRVYAQPQRLMILSCLLRGERTVAEIGEITEITQPALSQQLAELRRADLVSTRKEAKQVWYSLASDSVDLCVHTMEAIFCGGQHKLALPTMSPSTPVEKSLVGVAAFAKVV
ncbi:MAG: transcriptional regulator [Novosphingobium sp. 32-60-15]|uniref:ArsR/SmtB family transcription factor n=1 Tax=unclassified Novosphingobium TaxID=2644732 RepID=UPI000BDD91AA|nr:MULTISPECIES: metalloregulator ArsR/SmtB family transcription factor [unclassified Novosphingobium]OYX64122.1 MAG: transcriptional regulator [Novosphingobium sp. 32-60-15]